MNETITMPDPTFNLEAHEAVKAARARLADLERGRAEAEHELAELRAQHGRAREDLREAEVQLAIGEGSESAAAKARTALEKLDRDVERAERRVQILGEAQARVAPSVGAALEVARAEAAVEGQRLLRELAPDLLEATRMLVEQIEKYRATKEQLQRAGVVARYLAAHPPRVVLVLGDSPAEPTEANLAAYEEHLRALLGEGVSA